MVNQFIDTIYAHPLYAAIAILLGLLLLFVLLRLMIRAIIVLLVVVVLYAGFLTYSGKPLPGDLRDILNRCTESIGMVREEVQSLLRDSIPPEKKEAATQTPRQSK